MSSQQPTYEQGKMIYSLLIYEFISINVLGLIKCTSLSNGCSPAERKLNTHLTFNVSAALGTNGTNVVLCLSFEAHNMVWVATAKWVHTSIFHENGRPKRQSTTGTISFDHINVNPPVMFLWGNFESYLLSQIFFQGFFYSWANLQVTWTLYKILSFQIVVLQVTTPCSLVCRNQQQKILGSNGSQYYNHKFLGHETMYFVHGLLYKSWQLIIWPK